MTAKYSWMNAFLFGVETKITFPRFLQESRIRQPAGPNLLFLLDVAGIRAAMSATIRQLTCTDYLLISGPQKITLDQPKKPCEALKVNTTILPASSRFITSLSVDVCAISRASIFVVGNFSISGKNQYK